MCKATLYNGYVDTEFEIGSLTEEFVNSLDVPAIIDRCFGTKKGGDIMTKEDKKKEKAAADKRRRERAKRESQWRVVQELRERDLKKGY